MFLQKENKVLGPSHPKLLQNELLYDPIILGCFFVFVQIRNFLCFEVRLCLRIRDRRHFSIAPSLFHFPV